MMRIFTAYPTGIKRSLEIIFPLLTWAIITLPLWLSPFHPAIVAYFILTFNIYFFYKSFSVALFSTISFFRLKNLSTVNWASLNKPLRDYSRVYHVIIIPNYKESAEKIRRTLEYLTKQDFPLKRLFIVLGMEEREGIAAKERGYTLTKEFEKTFGLITATYHPDVDGEVKGKASNSAWAGKVMEKILKEKKIDENFVTVTSCDSDSLLPQKYFSYLTYSFLTDNEKYYHFYWAPVLLYSNFWEVPLPIRLQATLSSIVRLASLSRPDSLIQISTYSLSFSMLKKIGYWDTNIIPEDWHVFLQAFFQLGEKVRTIPLYLVITRDAVNGTSLLKTLHSRYEQEKRWAWGVTDIPYAVHKFFTTPTIPLMPKFFRLFYVIECHVLWPTSFFLLTFGASIPALINRQFARTSLGYNLPKMSGLILTITLLFIIVLIVLDSKSRPKRPSTYSIAKTPLLLFQWILLPVVSFFFSSLPALEAHTRLLLGKRLEYKVTEKY